MAFKFVAFAAFIAVARAGVIAPAYSAYAAAPALGYAHAPVAAYAHGPVATYAAAPAIAKVAVPAEYDAHPQYHYAYSVSDALTGDNKHQEESRDGDVVKGSYSLVESDGTRRIVDYTADPINGFNAVVHKEGVAVQKAIVAAPAYAKVAAPLAYAAPVAHAYHAAPVVSAYHGAPAVAHLAHY